MIIGQALVTDVGEALLSWAVTCIGEQGRQLVRLDCTAGNGPLRDYYERLGFTYWRQVNDRDYVTALYERRL